MGWIFFSVIILALVWLATENRTARLLAVLFAIFYAIAAAIVLVYLDDRVPAEGPEGSVPGARDAGTPPRIVPLETDAVALIAPVLSPVKKTVWNSDGTSRQVDDLTRWRLSGKLRAVAQKTTLEAVNMRVRLFSCPDFYRTPQGEHSGQQISSSCITIGDRSVTVYQLGLKTGEVRDIDEPVVFDSQPPARNWRYAVEVTGVTAPSGT